MFEIKPPFLVKYIPNTTGRQPVEPSTNTLDGDDVKIPGSRVIGLQRRMSVFVSQDQKNVRENESADASGPVVASKSRGVLTQFMIAPLFHVCQHFLLFPISHMQAHPARELVEVLPRPIGGERGGERTQEDRGSS